MEYLNISNNQLDSLNVFTNKNLLKLSCYSNSLTKLEINEKLEKLDSRNNNLSNINLIKATQLKDINLGANSFKIIDLSNLFNLEYFDCKDNLSLNKVILPKDIKNNSKFLKDSNSLFVQINPKKEFSENELEFVFEAPPFAVEVQKAEIIKKEVIDHSKLDLKYNNEPIIQNVDEKAEFINNEKSLLSYLKDNIIYPKIGYKPNGNISATFIIEKTGEITNVRIKKGLGFGSDEAVADLLYYMPKWKPAKKSGEFVRSIVPITVPY